MSLTNQGHAEEKKGLNGLDLIYFVTWGGAYFVILAIAALVIIYGFQWAWGPVLTR